MATAHPDNGNSTKSLVSMRDYVDLLYKEQQDDLAAQKELLCVKIEALEKATTLAKENMDIRMTINNEWKDRSIEAEKFFARRDAVGLIEGRVAQLELARATVEGKASQASVNIAYLLAVLGWVVALALKFIK
jgi:hypothetical protein